MGQNYSTSASGSHTRPDVIVVGGGTAGLVVASRLSEDPNVKVLVLEAGSHHKDDPNVNVPGLMTQLYGKEEYDWRFMSEPQEALNGRQIACPRGKMLGGSSAMNFSAILYPSRADLDAWTELGNEGWSNDDMEPYFRKFQNFHPPELEVSERMQLHDCVDTEIERTSGPLPVTFLRGYGAPHQAWMKTFSDFEFGTHGDPIHGKKLGAFVNPVTIDPESQTRAYSASAYYSEEVAARPNLQVWTDVLVKRIILKDSVFGKATAEGVEILTRDGRNVTLNVNKGGEIILSAGVIKSPQLLELSGIGQDEILEKHGITVKVSNQNVGENLQDHPLASISFEVSDEKDSGDIMRISENAMRAFEQYQTTKEGPLSGAHLAFAYSPVVGRNGRLDASEVRQLVETHLEKDGPVQNEEQTKILAKLVEDQNEASGEYMLIPMQLNTNISDKTEMSDLFTPRTEGNYVTIVAMLNRPFSRGSTHIRSGDVQEQPAYDPRYMTHPLDMELLARHTQFMEKIAESEYMSEVLKKDGRRIPERCNVDDLDEAKKVVVDRAFTAFHPCGTCAMMPEKTGGVVDDKLRVYGTENVRVVDASIFPIIPLGNIQAMVYACAERASDIIKADR